MSHILLCIMHQFKLRTKHNFSFNCDFTHLQPIHLLILHNLDIQIDDPLLFLTSTISFYQLSLLQFQTSNDRILSSFCFTTNIYGTIRILRNTVREDKSAQIHNCIQEHFLRSCCGMYISFADIFIRAFLQSVRDYKLHRGMPPSGYIKELLSWCS